MVPDVAPVEVWPLDLGIPRLILSGSCRIPVQYCFPHRVSAMCSAGHGFSPSLAYVELTVVPSAPPCSIFLSAQNGTLCSIDGCVGLLVVRFGGHLDLSLVEPVRCHVNTVFPIGPGKYIELKIR